MMTTIRHFLVSACLACISLPAATAGLTLDEAIRQAQANDPWLLGSTYREAALQARGTAAGTLPDPTLAVGFANLPTDTFEFNQEPMTQFRVGVHQQFPRGDTRVLQQRQLSEQAGQQPYDRADRRARLAVDVASAWLDVYAARESIRLIVADRSLFVDLVSLTQNSYASALGRTQQQDIVRAQLELTRLDDRLAMLQQQADAANARLGEWLAPASGGWHHNQPVADALPALALTGGEQLAEPAPLSNADVGRFLQQHPLILGLDARVTAGQTGVEVARQQYKPQWGINASYGYRDDDPVGQPRADFFSLGVTFDLPLWTDRRQDQQLASAVSEAEALRTDRSLALRRLRAGIATERARLLRLNQRRALYREQLLEQMTEQAEASLSAYTSDRGDFAEVVRARIAELNAKIEALEIEVERTRTIARLNYFFVGGHTPEDNPS